MPITRKSARAVHANIGVRQRYQRQLLALIREMAESVETLVTAQREASPPVLASDASPSEEMLAALHRLADEWQRRFKQAGKAIAAMFVKQQFRSTDAAFRQALRDAGWSVQFTLTPAMEDALEAAIAENVGLIRSIASQYLQEVEGIVMRNYTAGRNVASMAKEIRSRHPVFSHRAMLIARDQSNKANAVVQRARQKELGIEEAIWLHSHGGKTPRPTHVAMDGKRYKVSKGMWDSAEKAFIFPGELINCRCVNRSVLPWTPSAPPATAALATPRR